MFKNILIAVFLVTGNFYLFAKELPHRILIINSYHTGLSWTDSLNKGFIEAVKNYERPLEVYIENLDTKRFPNNLASFEYRQFIISRIKQVNPKLIAITDDDASILMESLIKEVKGLDTVPVVFMGVNQKRNFPKNFTGIYEIVNIKANLELIKQLQPNVKTVYCVTDNTTTGQIIAKEIKSTLLKYNPGYDLKILGNCTYHELLDSLSVLTPKKHVVLFFLFNRDSRGLYFSYESILDSLYRHVNVPIYGTWSFYLNHGIVGGGIISGYNHGKRAGEIAQLILKGVSPSTIPVAQGPCHLLLDYSELVKHPINKKLIPGDVLLINKPEGLFKVSKAVLYSAGILVLLLITILFFCFSPCSISGKKFAATEILQFYSRTEKSRG